MHQYPPCLTFYNIARDQNLMKGKACYKIIKCGIETGNETKQNDLLLNRLIARVGLDPNSNCSMVRSHYNQS